MDTMTLPSQEDLKTTQVEKPVALELKRQDSALESLQKAILRLENALEPILTIEAVEPKNEGTDKPQLPKVSSFLSANNTKIDNATTAIQNIIGRLEI